MLADRARQSSGKGENFVFHGAGLEALSDQVAVTILRPEFVFRTRENVPWVGEHVQHATTGCGGKDFSKKFLERPFGLKISALGSGLGVELEAIETKFDPSVAGP